MVIGADAWFLIDFLSIVIVLGSLALWQAWRKK